MAGTEDRHYREEQLTTRRDLVATLHRLGCSVHFIDNNLNGVFQGETDAPARKVTVLLNRNGVELSDEAIKTVLWHELAHVRGEFAVAETEQERRHGLRCGNLQLPSIRIFGNTVIVRWWR